MIQKNFIKIAAVAFLFMQFISITGSAQGDLLITPRRVVFDENRQRQEITLANTGQDTASYSISFVQYDMTEDGSFKAVTEPRPGQMFADEYLRFFPRSVTLAPNESQIIRMQVRRRPGMKEGEYRSHMYFRSDPREQPLGEEEMASDSSGIDIRLTPVFGITIPVIIRVGNVSASVNLTDIELQQFPDNDPLLHLTFQREGNRSVYGDLTVDYVSPEENTVNVGRVRGIAVYTPNSRRTFSLRLSTPEGVDYSRGKLLVRYSSGNDVNPEVFDKKEVTLP